MPTFGVTKKSFFGNVVSYDQLLAKLLNTVVESLSDGDVWGAYRSLKLLYRSLTNDAKEAGKERFSGFITKFEELSSKLDQALTVKERRMIEGEMLDVCEDFYDELISIMDEAGLLQRKYVEDGRVEAIRYTPGKGMTVVQ